MKLPEYRVDIDYSAFTHNKADDPAYNPGRPSPAEPELIPVPKRNFKELMPLLKLQPKKQYEPAVPIKSRLRKRVKGLYNA